MSICSSKLHSLYKIDKEKKEERLEMGMIDREEQEGEAGAGFKVALTQDISLGDSRDRRGARLCLQQ